MKTPRLRTLLAAALLCVASPMPLAYADASSTHSGDKEDAAPRPPAPMAKSAARAGVGVVLDSDDGKVLVEDLIPSSSAAASKLIHRGDYILAVGEGEQPSQPLKGRRMADVLAMIRGKDGSQVRLTVVASGADDSAAREVLLIRAKLREWGAVKVPPGGPALQPGDKVPALAYTRLNDSREASLESGHRGKIVVLEFWATWCGPCQLAMDAMQKTAAQFAGQSDRIVFLTVCIDGTDPANAADTFERVAAHAKRKGWTTTINGWATPEGHKTWHIGGVPYTYIIDADGKVVAANPQQKLEDVIAPLLAR